MNAAGERLIDGRILNATLVLVVVIAVLGPILTERAIARLRADASPLAVRNSQAAEKVHQR